jgi:hypothetical protein
LNPLQVGPFTTSVGHVFKYTGTARLQPCRNLHAKEGASAPEVP